MKKNAIIEKISLLKEEANKHSDFLSEFGARYEKSMNSCFSKYNKLFLKAKDCLEKISALVAIPFLKKFSPTLCEINGALYLNGKYVEHILFDRKTCFDILPLAIDDLIEASADMLDKISSGLNTAEELFSDLARICSAYNTVLKFYEEINTIFEEAKEDECKKLYADKNNSECKLQELEKDISSLEEDLSNYEKNRENLKKSLCFDHNFPIQDSFLPEIHIPIGFNVQDGELCDFLEWKLEKENVLCIKTPSEAEKSTDIYNIIRNVAYRFISSFPAGTSRVALCDLCGDADVRILPSQIVGNSEILPSKLIYDYRPHKKLFETDIFSLIKTVSDLITSRTELCKNIYDYNAKNEDTFFPPTLVIINGFTNCRVLDENTVFGNIPNGAEKGVYFLVTQFESPQIYGNRYHTFADVKGAKIVDVAFDDKISLLSDDSKYSPVILSESFVEEEYRRRFEFKLFQKANFISLEKCITEYKRDKSDFSHLLKFPIGKSPKGALQNLILNAKDTTPHCVILGESGTGKSSLLQAIVLSSAYLYSPDELEIYLIDMKRGSSFYSVKSGYDYSKLKHVKMMSTDCSTEDLRYLISYIAETKIRYLGDTDIISYNKNRAPKDKLKRTIIVIDEYTDIKDDKCIQALETIAKKGRSFGLSLVISSLEKVSDFQKLLNNIRMSIEFRNNSVGQLISRDGRCSISNNDILYLSELTGNCLMRVDMDVSKFRVAYEPNQSELIDKINKKYDSYNSPPTIIIGNEPRLWKSFDEQITGTDTTDVGTISVNIGKKLSGEHMRFTMSSKMGTLLILGNKKRAQSIEYSLICSKKGCVADQKQVFFLNFGYSRIPEKMMLACQAFTEIAFEPEELLSSVKKIGDILEKRIRYQELNRGKENTDNNTPPPILVIMHEFDQHKTQFSKTEKSTPKDSPMPFISEASKGFSKNISVKMPPCDIEQLINQTTERNNFDPTNAILKMIKEGPKYNIYFCVHVEPDNYTTGLFESRIHSFFKEFIVIPEVTDDTERERNNIISSLRIANTDFDYRKADFNIQKLNEVELHRCYYITGDRSIQLIPYEWRE